MRKVFTLILAFAASVGTLFADYENVPIGELYYNLNTTTRTAEVTMSHDKYSGAISIPPSVEYDAITYDVTSIGDHAFSDCSALTSIIIPSSVTSIEDLAFEQCNGLTNITIPNSVTSIGVEAFYFCTALTSITIPSSVTSIRGRAFWGCSGLTSIVVEKGNKVYDSRDNCNAIIETASNKLNTGCMNTTIPNNVTTIGDWAFSNCSGLESISIPNSVTSIGNYAFHYCLGLTSITIPNSVTSIGEWAFAYDEKLTSITIPNSVTSIGNDAFQACYGLTNLTISGSVTSIGVEAFYACSALTSITCEAVEPPVCGKGAFGFVDKNIPLYVPAHGVEAYNGANEWREFSNVKPIQKVGNMYYHFNVSDRTAEVIANPDKYKGNITIPEILQYYSANYTVTGIRDSAFLECSDLNTITIPGSITTIGKYAFLNCRKLTSITCLAVTPPTCGNSVFYGVSKAIPLNVFANSVEDYKLADQWKDFRNIKPLQAEESDVTDVTVEPTDNSAIVEWPAITDANSYELIVKDKDGNVICTLIFDEKGVLLSIAFNAPRRKAPQQMQTAGFAFTVTGLDSGTSYNVTLTAKNSDGDILDSKTITFTTNQPQDIYNPMSNAQSSNGKYIQNGHLYIERNGEIFNLNGARVK